MASRESLNARNLRECEDFCLSSKQYTCSTFSFTSTAGYTNNYPNCELSELDERNLSDRDLDPDYSGDVYIISSSCGGGGGGSHGTGSSYISKSRFELVRSLCIIIFDVFRMFKLCQAGLQIVLRLDKAG